MKKMFNLFARPAILLVASIFVCVLMSCGTMSAFVTTPKTNYAQDEIEDNLGTPENSVLVFGMFSNVSYVEMAPNSANISEFKEESNKGNLVFAPKPMPPKTSYKVKKIVCTPNRKQTTSVSFFVTVHKTTTEYYVISEGDEVCEQYNFTAPSKPGLYFYGLKKVKNPNNLAATIGKQLSEDETELMILRDFVAKMYAGTSWEPVIKARIEELTAIIKK